MNQKSTYYFNYIMKKICVSVLAAIMFVTSLLSGMIPADFTKPILVTAQTTKPISKNETMIQYFEWDLPNNGTFWNTLAKDAKKLSNAGFTSVWLPPAYKGGSSFDVGYGAYDLYDLGEFNQKGTIRTKYGKKNEYVAAIKALKRQNVKVYADIVLNHKGFADTTEMVSAIPVNGYNRNQTTGSARNIRAWSRFNFPGRNNKYSSFKWNASHFTGVDYDDATKRAEIYRFANKSWASDVDNENGNYDYLMFSDIDHNNEAVKKELQSWGKWYVNTANLDGFRLDAVKHMSSNFVKDWLTDLRKQTGKELFSVGEYYSGDLGKLNHYINATGGTVSLFDFPLHYRFKEAAYGYGNYNMSYLFNNTLTRSNPAKSVTFVDNHDTQPGQGDPVAAWFKPLAYTAILTREGGYPCVFYGDYYGTSNRSMGTHKYVIDRLMKARTDYAYGTQHDYLNNSDIIGWTREGDSRHANSGLAALISDRNAGSKKMYVGTANAGETWYDLTGNCSGTVKIDKEGNGTFRVAERSHSVWVKKSSVPKSNKVTVYYKTSYPKTYIHYQIADRNWTAVPGVKMDAYGVGYVRKTINMGADTKVSVCFNNGSGTWDNNGSADYTLNAGTYRIEAGRITEGKPTFVKKVSGVKLSSNTTRNIKLKWTKVKDATGYEVYRYDAKRKSYKRISKINKNKTSFTDKNRSSGTTYQYKIRAYKKIGKKDYYGAYSKEFVTTTKPTAPVLTLTAGKGEITAQWKRKSVTGYQLYMATSKSGKYTKIKTTSKTSFTQQNLQKNKRYYFKVRAYKTIDKVKIYGTYSKAVSIKAR